jgi:2-keto-3-deoxy-L-fuconate dehydrogenase
MFSMKNKTAIVTGGASGIGLAISKLFALQGAAVHILELNDLLAKEEAGKINAAGGKATAHKVDISQQQEVNKAIAIIARNGSIDILVNNAGIAHVGNAGSTNEEDFDRIYAVNVKGTYNCIHAVLTFMLNQKKGVMLNMASVASSTGIADRFAYSMSKAAIVGMTLSVAKDYIKEGIRCNCISPARVYTPFVEGFLKQNYPGREKEVFAKLEASQPIGRMATPEEIAYLALYLCSDEASFVTGCDYPIDGGFIKLNN